MAGRSKAKCLTNRDLGILERLGQGGVASLEQLRKLYWKNAQTRTARDRLLQLEKAGYIKSHYLDLRKPGELLFSLTRKGAKEFPVTEQHRFIIGLPAAHEIRQQLLLQDGRMELEEKWVRQGYTLVDWRNERELRSEATLYSDSPAEIADAEAVLANTNGEIERVSIEADGDYYGRMLAEKLTEFARGSQNVIWVTQGHGRAARMLRETSQLPNIQVYEVAGS